MQLLEIVPWRQTLAILQPAPSCERWRSMNCGVSVVTSRASAFPNAVLATCCFETVSFLPH